MLEPPQARATSLFAPTRDRALLIAWFSAACFAIVQLAKLLAWGWGGDSVIYWSAWDHASMYDTAPGVPGGYVYPPILAQVLWPLTLLPWPVFQWGWLLASVVAYWWLLRPIRWVWAVPLASLALEDIRVGNIMWLLAIAGVLGIQRAGWWLIPALTKITPAAGALWFAGRGEWRALLRAAVVGASVVAASVIAAPALWAEWLVFMQGNGSPLLVVRVAVAGVLAFWAGRVGRPWLIPFAMLLASPVLGFWPLALLCALPRVLPVEAVTAAARPFGGARATIRRIWALTPSPAAS